MKSIAHGLWAGVAIVALAYVLMGFVKEFIPVLVVMGALTVVYSLFFRKKW